MKKRFLFKN